MSNLSGRLFKGGIAQEASRHLQSGGAAELLMSLQQLIQTGITQHHRLTCALGHSQHLRRLRYRGRCKLLALPLQSAENSSQWLPRQPMTRNRRPSSNEIRRNWQQDAPC